MSLKPLIFLAFTFVIICQRPVMAEQPGHVTGVGGVFVKSKDPKALAQWYREVLGLEVKPWGGAAMPFDAPGHPPKVSWTAFPDTSDYPLDAGVHD
jgi:catechol-2,3-dioxygenase